MQTKRLLRVGVVASLLAAGLGSTGCQNTSNTATGAGVGGLVGAGAGAALGTAVRNPLAGAAIGGLVGAGTGAAIGNDVDRQQARQQAYQQYNQAVSTAAAQAQAQRMGITDVIQMAKSGQSDQVIVNQIRATGSVFQLSPADLGLLKENGVSDRVIAEMQMARPQPVVVGPPPGGPPVYVDGGPYVYGGPTVVVAPRPYYYGYGWRRW